MTAKKEDTQEGAKEKKEDVKTIIREFEGYGKFTVRGSKGGERLKIQSDAMTVDERTQEVEIDASAVGLGELNACLVGSPKGPHPGIPYLEGLLSGMVEDLIKDIKELSKPKSKVIKN